MCTGRESVRPKIIRTNRFFKFAILSLMFLFCEAPAPQTKTEEHFKIAERFFCVECREKIQPNFVIGEKSIGDLILENLETISKTLLTSRNMADRPENELVATLNGFKGKPDSLNKEIRLIRSFLFRYFFKSNVDELSLVLTIAALKIPEIQDFAAENLVNTRRIDYVLRYSDDIKAAINGTTSENGILLFGLVANTEEEKEALLRKSVNIPPQVRARFGDTLIENEIIRRIAVSCDYRELRHLGNRLAYIGTEKSARALVEQLRDSSYWTFGMQTYMIRESYLFSLGKICPCESIFGKDLISIRSSYDKKAIGLYMLEVYNWAERNFGLKLEELKTPHMLIRTGGGAGDRCFKEE